MREQYERVKEKVKKKHKALLTEVFRELVKPPSSDTDSDSEYSSATEAESTNSELEAVTSGLKRLLSSDESEFPTLKKERLSLCPTGENMADSEAARLEKEKAERAALKKRTEEEAAARKAEQEARERCDREIRARREQE